MSDTPLCSSIEPRLPAYLAGELPETERAAIQAHLAGCPACRELADTLHLLHGALAITPLTETLDPARRVQIQQAFGRRVARPTTGQRWAAFLEFLNPARAPTPALRLAVALIVFVALPLVMMKLLLPASMKDSERWQFETTTKLPAAPATSPVPAPKTEAINRLTLSGESFGEPESNVKNKGVVRDADGSLAYEYDDRATGATPADRGRVAPHAVAIENSYAREDKRANAPRPAAPRAAREPISGKSDELITYSASGTLVPNGALAPGAAPADETATRSKLGVGSLALSGGDTYAGQTVDSAGVLQKRKGGSAGVYRAGAGQEAVGGIEVVQADKEREKRSGDRADRGAADFKVPAFDVPAAAASPLPAKDLGLGDLAEKEDVAKEALAQRPMLAKPLVAASRAVAPGQNEVLGRNASGYTRLPAAKKDGDAKAKSAAKGAKLNEAQIRALLAQGVPNQQTASGGKAGEEFVTMDTASVTVVDDAASLHDWSDRKRVREGSELEKKLASTIIPLVDFRQAKLTDVMKFLEESVAKAAPDEKPVTIDAQAVTPPPGQKELGDFAGLLSGQASSAPAETPSITLSLRDVSALNALKYITEVASATYRMEGDKVVIEPDGVVQGRVVTRLYPVQPTFMDAVAGRAAVDASSDDGVKAFLENAGIPFPAGTSASYKREIGQLVVANTPENLEAFENTLANLDVVTNVPPREPAGFNPYIEAKVDAFSTFSIDVDTASYTLTRRALSEGRLPDPEEVRTEEIVNAFDYDYTPPAAGAFAMDAQLAPSPFRAPLELLKIGVQGRTLGRDAKKAAVLTLVIDTSGSMETPDRLGRIRRALRLLVDQLKPNDSVALVAFNDTARLLLDRTPAGSKEALVSAIDGLAGSGSTQLEGGLQLAYEVAARGFVSGGANRVILMSDGVANLGAATAAEILQRIEQYRKQGIYLTVLGFGSGNYDDAMLLQLADKGDGMYAYVDSDEEAKRLLVDQWEQTLHVIAKDVKIQVEFNPERVRRWRQIGYEKRHLNKEDFRNDQVDAGEVGSGQAVTALYDVELAGDAALPVATVRVRYQDSDTGRVTELEQRVASAHRCASFAGAPPRFRVAACAAEFAELLRASPFTAGSDLGAVADALRPAALALPLDQRVQELLRLVGEAGGLSK